jgi:3-ketosteroid 9alpha-monooxygenase subunit B
VTEAGPAAPATTPGRRDHRFHPLRVARVVEETEDARSYELAVPAELRATYAYRAGQFCTFRVHVDGVEHLRSYSMSSAPAGDESLTVTVKRVPGGAVSGWLIDNVRPGDELEVTPPAGVFCLQADQLPVVAYCGGSGITPVMSLVRAGLVESSRRFSLLYANRSPDSVIFDAALRELQDSADGRLVVQHHADSDRGFLTADDVHAFLDGQEADARHYVCGPNPFMELVERALLDRGVPAERIHIERFGSATPPLPLDVRPADTEADGDVVPETITLVLKGKTHELKYVRGDTVLETARRGALSPPFSCEAGNCATCMAMLREGTAHMRNNNALTDEEVEEGWILTCQSTVTGASVHVEYEDL